MMYMNKDLNTLQHLLLNWNMLKDFLGDLNYDTDVHLQILALFGITCIQIYILITSSFIHN